jgi:hypothetical protein
MAEARSPVKATELQAELFKLQVLTSVIKYLDRIDRGVFGTSSAAGSWHAGGG